MESIEEKRHNRKAIILFNNHESLIVNYDEINSTIEIHKQRGVSVKKILIQGNVVQVKDWATNVQRPRIGIIHSFSRGVTGINVDVIAKGFYTKTLVSFTFNATEVERIHISMYKEVKPKESDVVEATVEYDGKTIAFHPKK